MLVLAARQLRLATAVATLRWPRVSPPLVDVAFDVRWLNHQPLVYICAHGLEGGDTLYGDDGIPMLTADQIRGARMPGSIVYLAGCFGIGELSSAFLAAGQYDQDMTNAQMEFAGQAAAAVPAAAATLATGGLAAPAAMALMGGAGLAGGVLRESTKTLGGSSDIPAKLFISIKFIFYYQYIEYKKYS
jgi:hypothetical protein